MQLGALALLACFAAASAAFTNLHLLGCFTDKVDRALPVIVNAGNKASPMHCANVCAGYPYFGLQAGKYCLCGLEYGKYGRLNDSECETDCDGDSRFKCGSSMKNSVYLATSFLWLGCFIDRQDRALKVIQEGLDQAGPAYCSSACGNSKYFGLQSGSKCLCGDSDYDKHGRADSEECNVKCSGHPTFTCGGKNLISDVYLNQEFKRLGCFRDTAARALPEVHNATGRASPIYCAERCKAYRYFGLQAGHWCTCGNGDYRQHGELDDSMCNMKCGGNPRFTCGGDMRNEIYFNIHRYD